jgi:hypothetical protein
LELIVEIKKIRTSFSFIMISCQSHVHSRATGPDKGINFVVLGLYIQLFDSWRKGNCSLLSKNCKLDEKYRREVEHSRCRR